MNKTPSQRLQPIRHIAEGRTQKAARKLVDSQRRIAEAETKLRELRGYLQDYQAGAGTRLNPRLLENHRAFLAKLREAETYQAGAVERARQASAAERERWMHSRREQQVLERLAALYRGREHQIDERRAQKLMDEFALRGRAGSKRTETENEY